MATYNIYYNVKTPLGTVVKCEPIVGVKTEKLAVMEFRKYNRLASITNIRRYG